MSEFDPTSLGAVAVEEFDPKSLGAVPLDDFDPTSLGAVPVSSPGQEGMADNWDAAIAAQSAKTADQPGIGDDLKGTWTAFQRGTERLKQNFFGSGVGAAVTATAEASQAQKDLEAFDALVASIPAMQSSPMTAGQRNNLLSKVAQGQNESGFRGQTLGSNIAQVAKAEQAIKALPPTGGLKEFQEGNWVKALKENPIEVTAGLIAESLPQMAPAMLMAATTGPGAGAISAGLSSFGVETSNGVLDSLKSEGMNLADERSIRAFFNDPDRVERARDKATMRGIPVAAFDAATAGFAGKILKASLGGSARRAVAGALGEVAMQAAGGATGEALAQVASEGAITDPRSIAAESIAEVGSTLPEVVGALREQRAQTAPPEVAPPDLSKFGSKTRAEAPQQATPPQEADVMDALLSTTPTTAQEVSAEVLGEDLTELRQQEAIATGQPVEIPQDAPENDLSAVTEAPLTPEEGQDSTPEVPGLSTLDADTFQRLADAPLNEGFVAYQDQTTNDIFQVPQNATPDEVAIARLQAREESKEAAFNFLKADQDRQAQQDKAELESLAPVAKKAIAYVSTKEMWENPSQIQFMLDREIPALEEAKKNVKRAESGTLTRQGEKVTLQEATEELQARQKKVDILQKQKETLQNVIPPAQEFLKGMKRPKKGQEGSTQIPQAVLEAGQVLYRKGVEFKEWSASMVRNLGSKVRPFLKQIWDGVTAAVNKLSPTSRPQSGGVLGINAIPTSSTPEAYNKPAFARGMARFWLGQYGAYPQEIRSVMERKNMKQDAIVDNGRTLGRDLQKEIKAASKRTGLPEDLVREEVSKLLEGQPSLIRDPGLIETVGHARRYIDTMSEIAISSQAVKGPMVDTFRTNMGEWLKRYYSAFDPEANWNYDSLVKQAWKDGVKRTEVKDASVAKIITDAEKVIRTQNPSITDAEMEGVLRGLTDREQLAGALYGSNNTKIKKDVSSLIRRKEISPEIRALMGEEKNPVLRYEKSIQFMSQLLAKNEAQKALRTMGLQTGLFSPTQQGRYAVEIEQPDSLGVLSGLFTTKEFKAAMEEADAYSAQTRGIMGLIGKPWTRFATETKMAKVALNPDSWMTNFLGGIIMNAGNGVSPIPLDGKSLKAMQDARGIMYSGYGKTAEQRKGMVTQRLREMRARLVAEGVYHSNVALNDLEVSLSTVAGDMLEGGRVMDSLTGAARLGYYGKELGEAVGGTPGAIVGGAIGAITGAAVGGKRTSKAIQSLASKAIGTPDNFWKIVGFLDEFETYKRAFPQMSDQEVARAAAENVKNTRPTYSKIPQGLKTISRFGLINSFFQFNYEMFRNTFHTVGLGLWEVRSGNPVLQVKGAKRLAGLTAMVGLTSVPILRSMSQSLSGMDDEKQEAFQRSFAPPWDKDSALMYVESGKKGDVSYVNPQYLIPYNEITKGISAVTSGKAPDEVLDDTWNAYAQDFFASGVHVTPLIEAYVNQKGVKFLSGQKGTPITNRDDTTGFWERLDYALDRTVRPGAAEKAKRLALAFSGEQAEYGKKYTVNEQLQRSMGLRTNTYDVKKSLYFRLRDIREGANRAKMVASSAEFRGVSPESLEAQQAYTEERRGRYKAEYKQLLQDAITMGITDAEIKEAVKKAGVPLDFRK